MLLILMYRRESLIETKNTYPAKIKPAVPRILRAIFIALILCPPLRRRFISEGTMPLLRERMWLGLKPRLGMFARLALQQMGSDPTAGNFAGQRC
jgi:hypothetical protein